MTKKELLEQLQSSIVSDDDNVTIVLADRQDDPECSAYDVGEVLTITSVGYRPDIGAYLEATQQ